MNIDEFLKLLIKKCISDIHFKAGSVPRVRLNGRLICAGTDVLNAEHIEELATGLMSPAQKVIFDRENEIDFAYAIDNVSRFRANMYRQKGTTALTLRVVPLKVKAFAELNLPDETLKKLAQESRGLILIAGVTGAGKTTTLNAMLDYINENFEYKIVTVEDPIEFYHSDKKSSVSQREVGSDTKSYASALKNVLRQDPDVIVIGEMRDFEAVDAAIIAAETGHLVLSTIHTMDAVQTIDRIIGTYPPHHQSIARTQLSNVLRGIVCQRLCITREGEERIPVTEILVGTSLIRKHISESKLAEAYKSMEQGSYYGMHTFDMELHDLYKRGKISLEEALDKSSNQEDLKLKLRGVDKEN
jgi:twitching motility protein PilT